MQSVSVDQLVGMSLGNYQVERLLGHGQLSAVYLAKHKQQEQPVLITTFKFPAGMSTIAYQRFSARFTQEGQALVRLKHPHILPTYDFGQQDGYPYLVTAFVKGASLAQVLKQQQRFTPKQTLDILKQLASALDYAHSSGVVHGILSPSNVLMSTEQTVQIAGFGLKTVLDAQANEQNTQPQAHLFSSTGTFLGSPEYIAPERVMNAATDARSDIYALGVILFEMLTGSLPFTGENSLETALKRVQQPVPRIHALNPNVPEALDIVISKALERDPAKRFQHAGDLYSAYERVLKVLDAAQKPVPTQLEQFAQEPQITLPPTVNWFDEEIATTGKWQLMPPILTGRLPTVEATTPARKGLLSSQAATTSAQSMSAHDAPTEAFSANQTPDPAGGVDPFAWWTASGPKVAKPDTPAPGTFGRSTSRLSRRPGQQSRRRAIAFIAAGTATAGVLAVGGISFAHFISSLKHNQNQVANVPTVGKTTAPTATTGKTPTTAPTHTPQKSPTAGKTPTPKPTPTHTSQPTPTPTQPPPTPTPSHTGTVIGYTNMPTNTAKHFSNPADNGNDSYLIHLSNGNFVAAENNCTHEYRPALYYDSGQQKLVCSLHGAVFDPANGFNVVSGPGNGPLKSVSIRVNGDGTITTG